MPQDIHTCITFFELTLFSHFDCNQARLLAANNKDNGDKHFQMIKP